MKKFDLGQTLSIVANFGVIAGILFLALELRQNNDVLDLQVQSENRERVNTVPELVINNPEYSRWMAKDESELSEFERDRLVILGVRMLQNFEELYVDLVNGRVEQEDAARRLRGVWHRERLNYGTPLAWETYKSRADPEFIRWMEEYVVNDD